MLQQPLLQEPIKYPGNLCSLEISQWLTDFEHNPAMAFQAEVDVHFRCEQRPSGMGPMPQCSPVFIEDTSGRISLHRLMVP